MSFFASIGELIDNQELNVVEKKEETVKEQFRKSSVGDIIWAKRYANSYVASKIPEHHKEGPFIVLERYGKSLVCLPGSSVVPKDPNKNFNLSNYYYFLKKETNFNFDRIVLIHENSFIKKLDKLTEDDKEKLYKRMKQLNLNYKTKDGNKNFNLPAQVGDIIYYRGSKYIIVSKQNKQIACVFLGNFTKNYKLEDFRKLDYAKVTIFLECAGYNILDSVNNKILQYVLNKYNEYLKREKNKMTIGRGSVIVIDNKPYYLYGEEGQSWLLFEIVYEKIDGFAKIIVQGNKFYTDFNSTIKINKKEVYDNLLQATEDEIKEIKIIRKNCSKSVKVENKQPEITFKIGDIIELIENSNDRYFIISMYEDLIECLSINEMLEGRYINKFFIQKDIRKAHNRSIEGIKWLEDNPDFEYKYLRKKKYVDEILFEQRLMEMGGCNRKLRKDN